MGLELPGSLTLELEWSQALARSNGRSKSGVVFKVRAAACCLIVLASLAGAATADMVPEDPYTDVAPTPIKPAKDANSVTVNGVTVKGVTNDVPNTQSNMPAIPGSAKPDAGSASTKPVDESASARSNGTASTATVSDGDPGEEWWEQQEVQIGGLGLVFLALLIRGRRAARRRRIALETRRTQFGMSAVDPTLARINVAAWECGPAILPTAIEPEMVNGRRSRRASEPFLDQMAGPRPSSAPAVGAFAATPQPAATPPPGLGSRDEIPPGARPLGAVSPPAVQPFVAALGSQPVAAPVAQPHVARAGLPPSVPVAQPFVASAPWPSTPSAQPPLSPAPVAHPFIARVGSQPSAQPFVGSPPSVPVAQPSIARVGSQPSAQPFVGSPPSVPVAQPSVAQPFVGPAPWPSIPSAQPPVAPVPVAQPFVARAGSQPYGHYSEADRAAYGMTSPPQIATAPAARGSWHPTVALSQAAPSQPAPLHAPALQAFATQSPPQRHAPALQAFLAPPAPVPQVRRARFADGSAQPPIANPQPFIALPRAPAPAPQPFAHQPQPYGALPSQPHQPAYPQPYGASPSHPHPPAYSRALPSQPAVHVPLPRPPAHAAPTVMPHLARTQFAPQHEVEATTHYTPAPALSPQSFVLERSSTEIPQAPAPYPLTFPAFPEAAGAVMLAPIEPSGLNYWGPPSTQASAAPDFEMQFARGSQPVEHLDPLRVCSPDDETRIAPMPSRTPRRR